MSSPRVFAVVGVFAAIRPPFCCALSASAENPAAVLAAATFTATLTVPSAGFKSVHFSLPVSFWV